MTPAEALRNILSLVDGSDEMEDVHALQILLQSIKTLAEKGSGRSERDRGCGHEPGIKNRWPGPDRHALPIAGAAPRDVYGIIGISRG
jgi:hypothetical protein